MAKTNLITAQSPAELGYSMPAEWEKHSATWLGWPHNESDWPDKIDTIRWVYGEMVRKISQDEMVRLLVRSKAEAKFAASYLKRAACDLKRVQFVVHPTNRGWTRDSGPIHVRRGKGSKAELAIVHFHFNAWAKYKNWQLDTKVPETAAKVLQRPLFDAQFSGKKFVIEGGGIEVNGRGTLLTTEECYQHPTVQVRNPGMTKKQYDAQFKKYLGVTNVLWLRNGPVGDDTHGHIDDICRFTDAKTLVLIKESNKRDINYKPLAENWERGERFPARRRFEARGDRLADAGAGDLQELAVAGELREFLYQQLMRHRADVQRSERPGRARHPGRVVQGPPGRRDSRRGPGVGLRVAPLFDPARTCLAAG